MSLDGSLIMRQLGDVLRPPLQLRVSKPFCSSSLTRGTLEVLIWHLACVLSRRAEVSDLLFASFGKEAPQGNYCARDLGNLSSQYATCIKAYSILYILRLYISTYVYFVFVNASRRRPRPQAKKAAGFLETKLRI